MANDRHARLQGGPDLEAVGTQCDPGVSAGFQFHWVNERPRCFGSYFRASRAELPAGLVTSTSQKSESRELNTGWSLLFSAKLKSGLAFVVSNIFHSLATTLAASLLEMDFILQ